MSAKKSNSELNTSLNQKSERAMQILIRSYVTYQCKGEHPQSTEKVLKIRIEKQIQSLFA